VQVSNETLNDTANIGNLLLAEYIRLVGSISEVPSDIAYDLKTITNKMPEKISEVKIICGVLL
jgi:hypothetical protein